MASPTASEEKPHECERTCPPANEVSQDVNVIEEAITPKYQGASQSEEAPYATGFPKFDDYSIGRVTAILLR